MKTNLTIEKESFIKDVNSLRSKLNKAKETAYLDDSFYSDLEILENKKNLLLSYILPYYRKYIDTSRIIIKDIEQLGSFKLDTYLSSYIVLNKKTLLIASDNKKVSLLKIKNLEDNIVFAELEDYIKGIDEKIIYQYKINNSTIILFSNYSTIYILKDLILKKTLKTNINYIQNIINISDNKFLILDDYEKLHLVSIDLEKEKLTITNININANKINFLKKLNNKLFALSTYNNEVLILNNKFKILKRFKSSKMNPINIDLLITENLNKENLLITCDNGLVFIFNLLNNSIKEIKLSGSLFSSSSSYSTSLILSDNGCIYFLEENLSTWFLNDNLTLNDIFSINIINLYKSYYLSVDLEGNLKIIKLDRLTEISELLNVSLY